MEGGLPHEEDLQGASEWRQNAWPCKNSGLNESPGFQVRKEQFLIITVVNVGEGGRGRKEPPDQQSQIHFTTG